MSQVQTRCDRVFHKRNDCTWSSNGPAGLEDRSSVSTPDLCTITENSGFEMEVEVKGVSTRPLTRKYGLYAIIRM